MKRREFARPCVATPLAPLQGQGAMNSGEAFDFPARLFVQRSTGDQNWVRSEIPAEVVFPDFIPKLRVA